MEPRKAPRLPRDFYSDDRLNSDVMLAWMVWAAIVAVGVIGCWIWLR